MPGVGLRQRGMIPRRPLHPDPSHPLAAGLIFCQFSGNEQGRGVSVSWGQGTYGRASATTGNSGGFGVPLRCKWPSAGLHDWTMFTVVRATADSAYAALFEIPHNPTSTLWQSPYHAFLISRDSADRGPTQGTNDGASYEVIGHAGTDYFLVDGAPHSYAASWGTQGGVWWRDGVKWGTNSATPNGSSAQAMVVSGAGEIVFGGRSVSAPGEGYTGEGDVQALWGRRLSQLEIQMAHNDIFSLFRDGR